MENILFNQLKLVIFDVDGTLYYQKQLRKKMLLAILGYYIVRPWRFKEVVLLYHFRREREKRSGFQINDLGEEQYNWCRSKTTLSIKQMKSVIDKWMFEYPNQFLENYMYPGVHTFFEDLKNKGVLTAIYSDYPALKKLEAMGIVADLTISSTDAAINALKPAPNGILYILQKLDIQQKNDCLFIGDRQELDGECAKNAGVPFLLLNKTNAKTDFYQLLSDKFRSK